MKYFLKNNGSKSLITMFCGWGMDEKPLLPLVSTSDVLYIYDYNEPDFNFDFSKYTNKVLIAFSCGVFMACYLKNTLPEFNYKIAINGTLKPFDEKYGIKKEKELLFQNLSKYNYLEFREKMLLQTKNELVMFNKNQPSRTLESSLAEFSSLKKYAKTPIEEESFYDKIIISENDRIIPAEFQKEFWKENYKTISAAHFPFYKFNTIEEIISY